MGGSSGGGGTQTQTTEPWSGQAPFLRFGLQEARNIYERPPEAFTGDTKVGQSAQTQQALRDTQARYTNGSPITAATQGLAQNVLRDNPQFAGGQDYLQGGQDLGAYANFTGAGQAPTVAGSQQIAGVGPTSSLADANSQFSGQVTGLPDVTQQALAQTAQGQSLNGNPYLDQQFDQAAKKVTDTFNRDVSPGIAAQFSLAGRTGSDAQGDVQTQAAGQVSDSLGQLANQIYGGNYQQERDRQLQSASQLGSLSQAQQGLGLQAAGQGADLFNAGQQQDIGRRNLGASVFNSGQQQDLGQRQLAGSLYGQDQSNQLAAGGLDANVYGQQLGQQNTFAGLSNSLANQDYTNIDRIAGAGAREESYQQNRLNDTINRFNHGQNAPQQNLQNYIAAIQGNYGGSVTGPSQQQQGPSRGQAAIGGATAGAAFGPYGAAIGGVLGYALGG